MYALPKNTRRVTHRLTVEESNSGGYRRYDGTVRVSACIEDQDIIERILAHLRDKAQAAATLLLRIPPPRAATRHRVSFSGEATCFSTIRSARTPLKASRPGPLRAVVQQ